MRLTRLLYAWRRLRAPAMRHLEFKLYTRQGCHLCEEALQHLQAARARWAFCLTTVDVDGDPELAAQFGECVPVVTVNGKVRFRGGLNRVLLERLLRGEATTA
jgi:glutaredoxin